MKCENLYNSSSALQKMLCMFSGYDCIFKHWLVIEMCVCVCLCLNGFWGRPNEIATVCWHCIVFFLLFIIIALPNPYMAPVHKVNNWSNMLKALELKMQGKCRQSFSLPWLLLLFIVVSCRVCFFYLLDFGRVYLHVHFVVRIVDSLPIPMESQQQQQQ